MANLTITENGDFPINGISPGREFSIAASGTFASGVVKAQFATAPPVAAALTVVDNEDADAIVCTATDAGTAGNGISMAVVLPDAANAALSVTQTGRAFVTSVATGPGDAATVDIGTGADGTVTITVATVGPAGNLIDVVVAPGAGNSQAMTAAMTFAHARARLVVTLGTDSGGDADDTKNTATLITAAIDALAGFTAAASGTGDDPVGVKAITAFTGGGANAANISTVGDMLALFSNPPFARHMSVALAEDADADELIKPLAAASLTGGTAGTFEDFASDAISFSAAGEIIGTNCGVLPVINLNAADTTGSTAIAVTVIEIPR